MKDISFVDIGCYFGFQLGDINVENGNKEKRKSGYWGRYCTFLSFARKGNKPPKHLCNMTSDSGFQNTDKAIDDWDGDDWKIGDYRENISNVPHEVAFNGDFPGFLRFTVESVLNDNTVADILIEFFSTSNDRDNNKWVAKTYLSRLNHLNTFTTPQPLTINSPLQFGIVNGSDNYFETGFRNFRRTA